MFFLEDTCMPSSNEEIQFRRDTLEFDAMTHHVENIYGMYCESVYMEAEDKEGIFTKLKKGIEKILDKINRVIQGFFDGMKLGSKNRLTAERYMASETAELAIASDIFEMQKVVDEEFLRARPIVQKISKLTGKNAQDVADTCDIINTNLHNNRERIGDGARGVVKASAVFALRESAKKNNKEIQGWIKETKASMKRLDRNTEEKGLWKALNKYSDTLSRLTNACCYIGNSAQRSINEGEKKRQKEALKEAKRKAKNK